VTDEARPVAVADGLAGLRARYVAMPDAEVVRDATARFPGGFPAYPDWDAAGRMLHGLAALERTRTPDAAVVAKFDRVFGVIRRRDKDDWKTLTPILEELLNRR
jgi:hypothetical protein